MADTTSLRTALQNIRPAVDADLRVVESLLERASHVFLLTTTAPRFFEKFGFKQVNREVVPEEIRAAPEFASVCPSTATVMHLSVQAGGRAAKP